MFVAQRFATRLCVALVAMVAVGSAIANSVGAQEADVCTNAYTENQRLRKQGKLLSARSALLQCVSPSCPAMIQNDCAQWLTELDGQLPTIVVAAMGPDGRDTATVEIRDGGIVIATALDGRPIPLDPGPHELDFIHPGAPPQHQSILVREGERNRNVQVSFQSVAVPVGPRAPITATDGPPRGLAYPGIAIGGVGLAALGVFVGLGVTGKSDFDELDRKCGSLAPAPNTRTCSEDQIEPVETQLVVADVFLGVGAGLTALGLTLVVVDFAMPSSREAPVSLSVGPTGASALVRF
ncbi:MAG: hypothetical protein HOW73_29600 [Polyangiaceae bacterium]|nr:hypothetical protein [Polyangiaceae bacterium]